MSLRQGQRAIVGPLFYSARIAKLPVPKYDPQLADQVIIVTGSNGGLGYEASRHLLRIGVGKLIMAVRDRRKGEAARKSLLDATGRGSESVEVWDLDLSSYDSVKAFATRVTSELPRLDAVLANAGVFRSKFVLNEENESTITVNVVSQCLLLLLLLPKLREAPSTPRFSIVNSLVHYIDPGAELLPRADGASIFSRLNDPKTAEMTIRYWRSKLLALLATRELADRLEQSTKRRVTLNAPNPSLCRTELERENDQAPGKMVFAILGRTAEMGSRTLVHGVLAGDQTHGEFLNNCAIEPYVQSYSLDMKGRR